MLHLLPCSAFSEINLFFCTHQILFRVLWDGSRFVAEGLAISGAPKESRNNFHGRQHGSKVLLDNKILRFLAVYLNIHSHENQLSRGIPLNSFVLDEISLSLLFDSGIL